MCKVGAAKVEYVLLAVVGVVSEGEGRVGRGERWVGRGRGALAWTGLFGQGVCAHNSMLPESATHFSVYWVQMVGGGEPRLTVVSADFGRAWAQGGGGVQHVNRGPEEGKCTAQQTSRAGMARSWRRLIGSRRRYASESLALLGPKGGSLR